MIDNIQQLHTQRQKQTRPKLADSPLFAQLIVALSRELRFKQRPLDKRGALQENADARNTSFRSGTSYGPGPNYRLRLIRKALVLLGLDPDMARHGLTREVFFCSLASNALQFLRGDHKRVRYDQLPTVQEMSQAAMARWVVPRAERMPNFRLWQSERFIRELDGTDVHLDSMRQDRAG